MRISTTSSPDKFSHGHLFLLQQYRLSPYPGYPKSRSPFSLHSEENTTAGGKHRCMRHLTASRAAAKSVVSIQTTRLEV
jgi:hypothetical protein